MLRHILDLVLASLADLADFSLACDCPYGRDESLLCIQSCLTGSVLDRQSGYRINHRIEGECHSSAVAERSISHLSVDVSIDLVEQGDAHVLNASLDSDRITHHRLVRILEPVLDALDHILCAGQADSDGSRVPDTFCDINRSAGRRVLVDGPAITGNTLKGVVNGAETIQIQMGQISIFNFVGDKSLIQGIYSGKRSSLRRCKRHSLFPP